MMGFHKQLDVAQSEADAGQGGVGQPGASIELIKYLALFGGGDADAVVAECDFRGRHWTAWFTDEIALSEGPWKLGGLPGLILKATDSEGHYRFTANGIELSRTPQPMTLRLKNYELVSRKQYRKVHERYYDDPVGFINGQPGVNMTVTDGNGNKMRPRGIPHNPIERE